MQLQSGEKKAGLSLEVPGNFSLDKAETWKISPVLNWASEDRAWSSNSNGPSIKNYPIQGKSFFSTECKKSIV